MSDLWELRIERVSVSVRSVGSIREGLEWLSTNLRRYVSKRHFVSGP